MDKRGRWLIGLLVLLTVLLPASTAQKEPYVIINSEDWTDVYSGILYANFKGYSSLFITTKRYVTLVPKIVPEGSVMIFESERVPFTSNLAGYMKREGGYDVKTIYSSSGLALNLELAKDVNTNKFIVIDPTYGFAAVSVFPYATASGSFVLFAEDRNIDQVLNFLASKQNASVLVYGQVADVVLEKLSRFSPEIINTGHRYKDNLAIVEKHFQLNPTVSHVVLTAGEFLEAQVVSGQPVVLVGKERVLKETIDFINNNRNHLSTAVLIGNELTGSGRQLKEETGLPVFLKVGQGIPTGVADYEPIKALDMFFLPYLLIQVDLAAVRYNSMEKVLEVGYRNRGVRAHLSGTIRIFVDGQTFQVVGDKDLQQLERNETKGFRYPVDLSEQIAQNRNLTADIFTIYGESPEIIDRAIAAQVPIIVSSEEDQCELELGKVAFDERTQRIHVTLKNPSESECHASINLLDLIIDDQPQTLNYPGAFIPAGGKETFKIKQRMTPVDLEDNPQVHVRVFYGEQEGLLFKVLDRTMPFGRTGQYFMLFVAGIIAILLILVIILFMLWRRSRRNYQRTELNLPRARGR